MNWGEMINYQINTTANVRGSFTLTRKVKIRFLVLIQGHHIA